MPDCAETSLVSKPVLLTLELKSASKEELELESASKEELENKSKKGLVRTGFVFGPAVP